MKIFIVLTICGFVAYVFFVIRTYLEKKTTLEKRKSYTIEDFVKSLSKAYSDETVVMAYEDLYDLTGISVVAGDNLKKDLFLHPDDFDELLLKRLKELGVRNLQDDTFDYLFPLKTVEDYVNYLEIVKQRLNEQD